MTDLDQEPCPSGLIAQHLPDGRHAAFVLRIAERMLESWLLADRDAVATFLHVATKQIPADPEAERNPKLTLVNAARRSAKREIRDDIVPAVGSQGIVGRGYTTRVSAFVRQQWRPLRAAQRSGSLKRAIAAIQAAM